MYIFSNLAMSLDGKIATPNRAHFRLGTPRDRKEMQRIRKMSDGILMGATSLKAYPHPLMIHGAKKQPVNILLSRSFHGISPSWDFFKSQKIRRILFFTALESRARLKSFEKSSELILLNSKQALAPQMIKKLSLYGIQNLLVEGGGSIMWEFAKKNLIHRYHVTLTPRILGGTNAPTLVDGLGFTSQKSLKLKLKQAKVIQDEVYLIYDRKLR